MTGLVEDRTVFLLVCTAEAPVCDESRCVGVYIADVVEQVGRSAGNVPYAEFTYAAVEIAASGRVADGEGTVVVAV